MLRVVSWNINSIKARKERVVRFIERVKPDILCLQELKCIDSEFPIKDFEALDYQTARIGQKTYNGVAILSTAPLTDIHTGFNDDADDIQARFISASTHGISVMSAYVPNGQEVGSDKYMYKLSWLKRLRKFLDQHYQPDDRLILAGDFNVAPSDDDVFDPAAMSGTILFSEPEKKALRKVCDFGLKDTFRKHHQQPGHYSWWDYRQLGFQMDRGLRIDFILASAPLLDVCTNAWIERDERKGKKPSDHAPVIADFDL